ncbi:MAG: hypothetical protein M3552_17920 [Planctomycetota bacterium]|nr:hypothetical protein [Planctomycetaceae bacterium]MDQ3332498.1 hypothetical protein [Planctomycetota bacterium]
MDEVGRLEAKYGYAASNAPRPVLDDETEIRERQHDRFEIARIVESAIMRIHNARVNATASGRSGVY